MDEFKLIVAGGRDFNDYNKLETEILVLALETYKDLEVSIVSGMANGADSLAVLFAKRHQVKLYKFPAEWRPQGMYDPGAGHKRNRAMAEFADGLLAFWDGKSRGTQNMIQTMLKLGKPTLTIPY